MNNTENAPVVTITAAITAALTATLGLLSFLGIDQEVVGALQVSAAAWVVVGAMLVHRRTTPTDQVALTKDEAAALEDRGAIDIANALVIVILVVLIVFLVTRV